MKPFDYRSSELFCEDVALSSVAERFGTPTYVYSRARILDNFNRIERGLAGVPHLTCYSVKANSNLKILRLLHEAGAGFDIVSGGELTRVCRIGADPERLVFSGVGKTPQEMDAALQTGILMFNVESEGELDALEGRARSLGMRANLAIRINPDVEAETHPYISTGQNIHKFGVPKEAAAALYRRASASRHLKVRGIACHIGSQILDVEPFLKALDEILEVARQLRTAGIEIEFLDLGGGFGIRYAAEEPLEFGRLTKELTARISQAHDGEAIGDSSRAHTTDLSRAPYRLIIEPGRSIVGDAGVLLSRVLYVKRGLKNFIVADAGMNDLMRPALYGSYHEVVAVCPANSHEAGARGKILADVVGPLCETGDFLARDRELPDLQSGELLAILTSGAYGYVLASNYNTRPRPAEVIIDGNKVELIRARQSVEDLLAGEVP